MAFRTSTVDPEIGRLIAHHRKRKGILQVELADAAGVCHAQVSRYERGHEYVSAARRQKIAEALGVDPVVFADPALVEVTPYVRIFLEAFRRISTPAARERVMAQIENGRSAASC